MIEVLPADGLVIVAKHECHTCVLVEPVMQRLDKAGPLTVITQDDPAFPSGVGRVLDDQQLERSFHLNIEAVPTLIRFEGGREVGRTVGWDRAEWTRLAGEAAAGEGLPAW
ncbi:thioredoxin family protein [Reyranella sp.]|uniref:thioredoxin family protein n=1 Tax=Reyranella sp. TaxID=1929291 RepID=UPI0025E943D1|nr:thioredoxin family protein [Reyranella sp.]